MYIHVYVYIDSTIGTASDISYYIYFKSKDSIILLIYFVTQQLLCVVLILIVLDKKKKNYTKRVDMVNMKIGLAIDRYNDNWTL